MNYLLHLFLSRDLGDEALLGNLMGDFIKGPLLDQQPPAVLRGVALHRAQDAFCAANALFALGRARLPSGAGLFRGIVLDIFYDHLLAKNWPPDCGPSLEAFSRRIYRLLEENLALLPEPLLRVARRMIREDWLCGYAGAEFIDEVLVRLSRRIRRGEAMHSCLGKLDELAPALEEDLGQFLPQADRYTRNWWHQNFRNFQEPTP